MNKATYNDILKKAINIAKKNNKAIPPAALDEIISTADLSDNQLERFLADLAEHDIEILEELDSPSEIERDDQTQLDESYKAYCHEISKYPLLTASEEKELSKRIKDGDDQAKEKMITSNLRLVIKPAKKYYYLNYSRIRLSLMDLIQEGNQGLMKAVEKFDPSKGTKFSTYAWQWIRREILQAIRTNDSMIRKPDNIHDEFRLLSKIEKYFDLTYGRTPTEEELAQETGMSIERIKELKQYFTETKSLDSPISDEDGFSLGDVIPDSTALSQVEAEENRKMIDEWLALLTKREATVIRLRFGYDDGIPKTLKEVGQQLGLSKERVRQIEAKAFKKRPL